MKAALLALAGALLGAVIMYWSQHAEVVGLRGQVDKLARQAAEAKPAATPGGEPAAAPAPAAVERREAPVARQTAAAPLDDAVTRTELVRLLDEKNAKINAAEAAQRELRERVSELETKLSSVTRETEQLSAAQSEVKGQLESARRMAESLDVQNKKREERLAQVEVANQDLRKRGEEHPQRLAKLSELATQMDDLTRRRETCLSNVLRRYREATDLFRTMALRLDNPRDGVNAPPASNELSRIQQAITAADEDVRQLQALNAQAARIQKELALTRR
ncbi:MAG: hypothetical protein FJW31_22300 [Acidobacteria bacterium]|nr:hypothetical protein [Acidobacteriota bacterium]